jgi:hypothetical protein
VTLTSQNSSGNWEAAKWTLANGTAPIGFENGGNESNVAASNQSGTAAATDGEGANENDSGGESNL